MTAPAAKKPAAKKAAEPRRFRTTGKELPLRIDLIEGGRLTYEKAGEEFSEDEWPMPHVTIPNMVNHGCIEEVE